MCHICHSSRHSEILCALFWLHTFFHEEVSLVTIHRRKDSSDLERQDVISVDSSIERSHHEFFSFNEILYFSLIFNENLVLSSSFNEILYCFLSLTKIVFFFDLQPKLVFLSSTKTCISLCFSTKTCTSLSPSIRRIFSLECSLMMLTQLTFLCHYDRESFHDLRLFNRQLSRSCLFFSRKFSRNYSLQRTVVSDF